MTAGLRLETLGRLRITLDGVAITDELPHKGRALLCYLAVERGEQPRSACAALLWGECSEADATTSLRQLLTQLRRTLGPYLAVTRHTLALNPEGQVWLDCEAFKHHLAAPAPQADVERLRSAVELYAGDFLANFALRDAPGFDEWAALERERLRRAALHALHDLAQHDLRCGDYAVAIADTNRLLALDPWREEAHRQLMWLYVRAGQRSAALAQYQTCRRALQQELGVEPMDETTALYERIKTTQTTRMPIIPLPPTPLIGRAEEQAELTRHLAAAAPRLVTLVGPGGVGKTRLALEIAATWRERFLHGVRIVGLASISTVETLVPAIFTALGCTSRGSQEPLTQLCDYLADKDMLLVLDNFEQLIDGSAEVLLAILRHAPEVRLIVTSRERLQLGAEWLIELQGLDVPGLLTANIQDSTAVQLFVQSARRLRPDFALTSHDAAPVARICRLVEGLPLAIELAATWTRVLSLEQIANEIEQSPEFLAAAQRDLPARHQSLRTVFEHSWRLLTEDERGAMRRLALFRGGFTRDAAVNVAGASLALLRALVDQSLIRMQLGAADGARYQMHELVRQYALERLVASGEVVQTQERHLRYFVELAEAAEPHLVDQDQPRWLEQLEADRDNLRTALAWALGPDSSAELAELGARLAGALWRFWWMRNDLGEGRHWLEAVPNDRIQRAVRAKVFHGAGVLAHEQGNYVPARLHYEQSLALRRELGDRRGVASSLNSLGVLALDEGDYERARALYAASLELKRALGDRRGIAYSLGNLGLVTSAQGDYEAAERLYAEALALCRALGDRSGSAVALGNLGAVALEQRDPQRAASYFREALALFEAMGDKDGIAECLEGLAGVAHGYGEPHHTARLCGAAQVLRELVGAPLMPMERRRYENIMAVTRAQLGEAEFALALAEGRAFTLEQAIATALRSAA